MDMHDHPVLQECRTFKASLHTACTATVIRESVEVQVRCEGGVPTFNSVWPCSCGTMPKLPMEDESLRLKPFVRLWCNAEAAESRWEQVQRMVDALELACRTVVTQMHWVSFAVLCSMLTQVRLEVPGVESPYRADQWITLPSDSAHLYQIHDCSQGHGLDPRPRRRCYIAARLDICCLRPVG